MGSEPNRLISLARQLKMRPARINLRRDRPQDERLGNLGRLSQSLCFGGAGQRKGADKTIYRFNAVIGYKLSVATELRWCGQWAGLGNGTAQDESNEYPTLFGGPGRG